MRAKPAIRRTEPLAAAPAILCDRVGRTILGLIALAGCSADQGGAEPGGAERGGSISFNLLSSSNVQIHSVDYDVSTQPGTEVVNGFIPLPDDQSQHVPVLGIQSLSSGHYALTLSATGKLPDGTSVQCQSPCRSFDVTSGANTPLGDITLTCTISTQVDPSVTGSIDDVTVTCISCECGDGLLEAGEQCDPSPSCVARRWPSSCAGSPCSRTAYPRRPRLHRP